MSDFGKKQLAKFGWKEGYGLGRNNQGIANPLKPNLKFDNTGLGHDKAADFNNHWWERVYNEAATNVIVDKTNNKISMGVKNKDSVEITTNSFSMRKFKELNKNSGQIYNNFLKVATLTGGQSAVTGSGYETEQIQLSKTKNLSDEELFRACGGRTAHKGARHGLKMSGKLARLAEQDRHLMDSLANKTDKSNPTSIFSDWTSVKSKKNSKRIKCQPQAIRIPEEDESESLKGIIDNDTDYSDVKYSKRLEKLKRKVEIEMSETLSAALTLDSTTPPKKVSFQTVPTTIYPRVHDKSHQSEVEKPKSNRKLSKKKKKQRKMYEEDAMFPEVKPEPKKPKKRNAEEAQLDKLPVTPIRDIKNLQKFVSDDDESEDGHTTDSSTGGLKPRKTKLADIPIAANGFANLINEEDEYAKNKKKHKRKLKNKRKTQFEKNNSEKNIKIPVKKTIKKDLSRSRKKSLKRSVTKLSNTIENFVLSSISKYDDDVEIK